LVNGHDVRSTAIARRRLPAVVRPAARAAGRDSMPYSPKPRPVSQLSLLSRLTGPPRPPGKPKRIRGRPRPVFNRWNAGPPAVKRPPIHEGKPLTASTPVDSTENAPEQVPLFVVDARLLQSNLDVLDARPANILDVLEDACSTSKAAGHSDEEIMSMLAGGAPTTGQCRR
jgi:hypothetical protein